MCAEALPPELCEILLSVSGRQDDASVKARPGIIRTRMNGFASFMNFHLDDFAAVHTPLLHYGGIHVRHRNSTRFPVVLNKLSVFICCGAQEISHSLRPGHKFFVIICKRLSEAGLPERENAKPRASRPVGIACRRGGWRAGLFRWQHRQR